ncbi:hypothetical protein C8Q76DRAFT_706933 [Earliella scabrosa]|nr:hypothetical protein C8Q76DRAFT_706933 [Earliella scabrosa]
MMRNVTTYPTTRTMDIRQERSTPLYNRGVGGSLSSDSPLNSSTALDSTVGALLVGTFIGVMLYGFLVHQSFQYMCKSRDGWRLRSLVTAIVALETAHSVLCMHFSYHYLVVDRLSGAVHGRIWSANIQGILAGAIICLCQSFLARCVYLIWMKFGPQVVFTAGVLTLGQFGMVTAATVLLWMRPDNQYAVTIRLLNSAHSGLAVLANIILAASLIYCLLQNRSGFTRTNSIIRVLIAYTVNSGLLIGLSTSLAFIFALACPNSQVYAAIDIVATKIYAITLLAHLNSRRDLHRIDASGSSTGDHPGGCLSSLVMRNTVVSPATWVDYRSPVPEASRSATRTIHINVTTEHEVMPESESRDSESFVKVDHHDAAPCL